MPILLPKKVILFLSRILDFYFVIKCVHGQQPGTYYFWIDLQKNGSSFTDHTGNDVTTPQLTATITIGIDQASQRLAFDGSQGTLSALALAPNMPTNGMLCEFSGSPCPCSPVGWISAGGKCYLFQHSGQLWPPSSSCPSGSNLASDYNNIIQNWGTIQTSHPLYCGYGNYRGRSGSISGACFSYPQSADTWYNAEWNCQNKSSHIVSFAIQQQWDDFLTEYQAMSAQICSTSDLWLGYSRYAWNSGSFYSSTNYQVYPFVRTDIITSSGGDCLYYNSNPTTPWSLSQCSNSMKYICLSYNGNANCPTGWRYIAPNCYKFMSNPDTYANGKLACQTDYPASNLASFHSQDQWDDFNAYRTGFVNMMEFQNAKQFENLYIGYETTDGTTWTYADNSDPTWAFWSANPNPGTPSCVVSSMSNNYSWTATSCTQTYGIICMGPVINSCGNQSYNDVDLQCYIYVNTTATTWDQAARICNQWGGTLPIIAKSVTGNQQNQWRFFQQWRAGINGAKDNIWIGMTQYAIPGALQWMTRAWYVPADDNNFWKTGYPDIINPYVASLQSNNYLWTTEVSSTVANVICHLQKPLVCPTLEFYEVPCGTNCYYCYLPSPTVRSFGDGEDFCRSKNASAHIIDYQSSTEWTAYRDLHFIFMAMQYPTALFWVGYSRGPRNFNGPWVANHFGTPDAPLNASFWNPSQPNSPFDNNRYCISSDNSGNFSGRWNDDDCTQLKWVVCEIDTFNSFCPETWGEFNGTDTTTCYKSFPNSATGFSSAQTACKNIGSSLPSFHSIAEWMDFMRYRWTLTSTQHSGDVTNVWLGLNDNNVARQWAWIDGSNYNWSNWKQPSEPHLLAFPNYNYVSSNSNPSNDNDTMPWYANDHSQTISFICQMRKTPMTNPCPSFMSAVGSQCLIPITNYAPQPYTHQQAYAKCFSLNYTLPTFPTQQSWTNFLSWLSNMNQAKQWSGLTGQQQWPMQDFWLGLTNMLATPLSYQWDDGANFGFENFPGGVETLTVPTCYYADHPSPTWRQSGSCIMSPKNVKSLICQSGVPLRGRCANSYFAYQNDVCYMTVPLDPMTMTDAKANCNSLSGGFLPSFQSSDDWDDFLQAINVAETVQGLNTSNGVWIGLSDSVAPFLWQWQNNMNYNWTNWIPDVEPSSDTMKTCVGAVQVGNTSWQWERRSCNENLLVICQTRNYSSTVCSPGYSDVNGDGNCYQILPPTSIKSVTSEQALFYCQSINGTLPCFANVNDWNNFLAWKTNFDTSANLNSTDFWIGYNSDQTFSFWDWADNTLTGFEYWSPSMPQAVTPLYCSASMQISNYSWSNYDCTTKNIDSVICKEKQQPSFCPDNSWLLVGQVCYSTLTPEQQSQTSGQSACQAAGGTLPSFHSFQEFDDFSRLYAWYSELKFDLNTSSGIWTGLSDVFTPYVWQWVDNSSYNWNYWDVGVEPSSTISNHCVVSIKNSSGLYVWRRASCNGNAAVICQLRVPPLTTNCLPGWSDINGVCYRLWPGIKNLNSDQIETFCTLNGGTLPVFDSNATWLQFLDWKQNTARGRNYQSSSFWLDCCSTSTAPWQWSNGVFGSFSNWSIDPTATAAPFCSAALANQSYSWTNLDCSSTFIDTAICMQSTAVPASQCTLPYEGSTTTLGCYVQVNSSQKVNFSSALNLCPQLPPSSVYLPSFHHDLNWEYFNALRWYLAAKENLNPISTPSVWIGSDDQSQELIYQNSDGSNFNWANWKSGVEPVEDTSLNCVISPSLNNDPGYWTSVSCSSVSSVICRSRSGPSRDLCGVPGWSRIGNRCYQIIPISHKLNFYDANATCNQLNATLPSFDDQSQWNQFLQWRANFANAKQLNTTNFWLGAQYDNVTNQGYWTDYTVTSFTAWTSWYSGIAPDEDQCASSLISVNMSWLALDCNKGQPSLICQLIQYPVDCQMTDWVNTSCAQTCGNSTLQSTRTIAQINLNGGQPCPNDTLIVYDCLDQIPCPIDCQMTDWIEWSTCDCSASDDGVRQRTRTVIVEMEFNGVECLATFESGICPDATCWPMTKAQRIAAQVLQAIGCVWLLGICGGTFILCIMFRIFSMERLLHAGQELCIIFAHLFILLFRESVKNKAICTASAAFIQFFTLGSYMFILLEAIQMYAIVTNVTSTNILSWKLNLIAAISPPLLITSLTSAFYYKHYPAKFSCWLNMGSRIAYGTIVPVLLCSLTTIVILEAAGMGDYNRLPLVNLKKYTFNEVNQRGILFILPANVMVLFAGASAIYYQDISSFTLVCVLLIVLGSCILIFHCLSHAVLYILFKRLLSKLPCCKQKATNNDSSGKPPISTENLDDANTIPDIGSTSDDSAKRRDRQSRSRQSKDLEDFHRWIFDGRQDNMNKSESLLFD